MKTGSVSAGAGAHKNVDPRTAPLTEFLAVFLLLSAPLTSALDVPSWVFKAAMTVSVLLAVVVAALRWKERGPDGRRAPAFQWYHALLFAAGGLTLWFLFPATSMMSRASGIFGAGMGILALVGLVRMRARA